ncbi:hypothetical protein C1H76_4604 [Elsinoe australis]|uniref:Uncharacterized protein n=1 Tax=Elsinoe australis TaxID=40998 RepID=A0A4V6DUD6_9PEZI|nr:hypothetical protein C1H76_4604 [Elsinoe australis]
MKNLGTNARKKPTASPGDDDDDDETERPAKRKRRIEVPHNHGVISKVIYHPVAPLATPIRPKQRVTPACLCPMITIACITGDHTVLDSSRVVLDFIVDQVVTLASDLIRKGITKLKAGLWQGALFHRAVEDIASYGRALAIYGGLVIRLAFCKLLPRSGLGVEDSIARISIRSLSLEQLAIGEISRSVSSLVASRQQQQQQLACCGQRA